MPMLNPRDRADSIDGSNSYHLPPFPTPPVQRSASFFSLFDLPISSTLLRRLEYSWRFSFGLIFIIIICRIPQFKRILTVDILVPVFGIFSVLPTLGAGIAFSHAFIRGIAPACLLVWLLQLFSYPFDSITASAFSIFFLVIWHAFYFRSDPTSKRCAMGFTAIAVLNLANDANLRSDMHFSARLLASTLFAPILGIFASLIPFPRPAQHELADRFFHTCVGVSHCFHLYSRAFMCEDELQSQLFISRAKPIFDQTQLHLSAMRLRLAEVHFEPAFLSRWGYEAHRMLGFNTFTDQARHLGTIDSLIWLLANLNSAVRDVQFSDYHRRFTGLIVAPCIQLSSVAAEFLMEFGQSTISQEILQAKRMRVDEELNNLLDRFAEARQKIYRFDINMKKFHEMELETAMKCAQRDSTEKSRQSTHRGSEERIVRIHQDCDEQKETDTGGVSTLDIEMYDQLKRADSDNESDWLLRSGSAKSIANSVEADAPPTIPMNDIQFERDKNQIIDSMGLTFTTNDVLFLNFYLFTIESYCRALLSLKFTSKMAEPSIKQFLIHCFNTIFLEFPRDCVIELRHYQWKSLLNLHLWRSPVKIALIVLCASLLALIPAAAEKFDHSFWIGIFISFIISDSVGAAFLQCSLRVFGTLVGSVYGFLVFRAAGNPTDQNNLYGGLTLMALFFVVAAQVRLHPSFSYGGVVAAFTAVIIYFGSTDLKDEPAVMAFAMARIQQTVIAVLMYVIIEYFLWPIRASDLIRLESLSILQYCKEFITHACDLFNQSTKLDEFTAEQRKQYEKALYLTQSSYSDHIRISLENQLNLALQANAEPSIRPREARFPFAIYNEIFITIREIWNYTTVMNRSLILIQESFMKRHIPHYESLFQSLKLELEVALSMLADSIAVPGGSSDHKIWSYFTSLSTLIHASSHDSPKVQLSKRVSMVDGMIHMPPAIALTRKLSAKPTLVRQSILLRLHSIGQEIEFAHSKWVTELIRRVRSGELPISSNSNILSVNTFMFCSHRLLDLIILLGQKIRALKEAEDPALYDQF